MPLTSASHIVFQGLADRLVGLGGTTAERAAQQAEADASRLAAETAVQASRDGLDQLKRLPLTEGPSRRELQNDWPSPSLAAGRDNVRDTNLRDARPRDTAAGEVGAIVGQSGNPAQFKAGQETLDAAANRNAVSAYSADQWAQQAQKDYEMLDSRGQGRFITADLNQAARALQEGRFDDVALALSHATGRIQTAAQGLAVAHMATAALAVPVPQSFIARALEAVGMKPKLAPVQQTFAHFREQALEAARSARPTPDQASSIAALQP